MNSRERRIEKLEKIFFPKPQTDGMFFWRELLLYREYRKLFPDPNDAPDHLRGPYLLLHERLVLTTPRGPL
jgi:hypothetical protein